MGSGLIAADSGWRGDMGMGVNRMETFLAIFAEEDSAQTTMAIPTVAFV